MNSHSSKRVRSSASAPATTAVATTLQMEAVFQTLTQADVVAELGRRINPSSGEEYAPFREAIRLAGFVPLTLKTFKQIDRDWARCIDNSRGGDTFQTARMQLHKTYASIGEVPNGGVDRRAFENEVATNYGYTGGVQDDRLRPRSSNYGHHRDVKNRIFYEGSQVAILEGARRAKEEYNRTDSQIEAMPGFFLLVIDWAEGEDEEEESEEVDGGDGGEN